MIIFLNQDILNGKSHMTVHSENIKAYSYSSVVVFVLLSSCSVILLIQQK